MGAAKVFSNDLPALHGDTRMAPRDRAVALQHHRVAFGAANNHFMLRKVVGARHRRPTYDHQATPTTRRRSCWRRNGRMDGRRVVAKTRLRRRWLWRGRLLIW